MKIDRLGAIRQHLYTHGASTIVDLCESVGASVATVRRDLMALEKGGLIERVHGGARLAEGAGVELGFIQRENANIAAKRAIAEAAFELVEGERRAGLEQVAGGPTGVVLWASRSCLS